MPLAERLFLKSIFVAKTCVASTSVGGGESRIEKCEEVGEIPSSVGSKFINGNEVNLYFGEARGLNLKDSVAYVWKENNVGVIAVTNSSYVNELDIMFETLFAQYSK